MKCLYCDAARDPLILSLVPYCRACWDMEAPGVRAKLERGYRSGRSLDEIVGDLLRGATVIVVDDSTTLSLE